MGLTKVNGSMLTGGGGVVAKWADITPTIQFSTTAASTSTITMVSDLTAIIKPGMPIRFQLSGDVRYAICTAITSNLLTIAGAPLTTTATALQALSYSTFPNMVESIQLIVPGYWADSTDVSLLSNDLVLPLIWDKAPAKLVKIKALTRTTDTGASFPRINARIGDVTTDRVCTSNSNAGLAMLASQTWYSTIVDIDTSKYSVINGQTIELVTDANGGNDNAADLCIILTFVYE